MTYGRLDALSTRLAHHLAGLGVGPGAIVPLCFEKSLWTTVAALAVMKAGGACVTLDVTQPEERLRSIVVQVEAPVMLASTEAAELAGRLATCAVVVVDKESVEALPVATEQLRAVDPTSPLYVAFTSGSTGTPKGATITHSNFSAASRHQQAVHEIRAGSRVFGFASHAFDTFWGDTLHALIYGGCLCVPSEAQRRDDPSVFILETAATYAHLTPTVMQTLSDAAAAQLKRVVIGGEAVNADLIGRVTPISQLAVVYGPAECTVTVASTGEECKPREIGRGAGSVLWVAEAQRPDRLAAIGAVGELWVEGPLVGQGYLRDEARTAASFVIDPPWLLRGGPGQCGRRGRLYRTGDLVRYRADGRLEFVGRKDGQVKVRGQRIELGEVEHHVKAQLRQRCAEHLEPQVIAEVATPEAGGRVALVAVAPEGAVEHALRDVWAAVLRIPADQISVEAAFTRLGGDSITAMQVVSRCRARGVHVTVVDVLRLQTIRRLVAEQAALLVPDVSDRATAAQQDDLDIGDGSSSWLLSPIQTRFFELHPDGLDHFNQSFLLRLTRAVSAAQLRAAVDAVVKRHAMLRARFGRTEDGRWEQWAVVHSEGAYDFTLCGVTDERDIESIAQRRQRTLNIRQGPVFAVDLFQIGADDGEAQVVLFSAHHLVVDLVSWRIIWHDIQESLRGTPLPPPTTSFRRCSAQSS